MDTVYETGLVSVQLKIKQNQITRGHTIHLYYYCNHWLHNYIYIGISVLLLHHHTIALLLLGAMSYSWTVSTWEENVFFRASNKVTIGTSPFSSIWIAIHFFCFLNALVRIVFDWEFRTSIIIGHNTNKTDHNFISSIAVINLDWFVIPSFYRQQLWIIQLCTLLLE